MGKSGKVIILSQLKQKMEIRTDWGMLLDSSPSETRDEIKSMLKPDW